VKLPLIGKSKMTEISKEKLLEFWNAVVKKTGLKIDFRERMERSSGSRADSPSRRRGFYPTCVVLLAIAGGEPRKLNVRRGTSKVVSSDRSGSSTRASACWSLAGDSALEAAVAIAEQRARRSRCRTVARPFSPSRKEPHRAQGGRRDRAA